MITGPNKSNPGPGLHKSAESETTRTSKNLNQESKVKRTGLTGYNQTKRSDEK